MFVRLCPDIHNCHFLLFQTLGKYYLDCHDMQTIHYLSQGQMPKEAPQHLQNHFEAWKVRERGDASEHTQSQANLEPRLFIPDFLLQLWSLVSWLYTV